MAVESSSSRSLHLMAAFVLAFSYLLICSSAVPVTRFGGLMYENLGVNLRLSEQGTNLMKDVTSVHGRMAVELDDYPGSGANNRHTPRTSASHD